MKRLTGLLKLEIKRAEGIYFDHEALHRAVVVQTPFRKVLRRKWTEKLGEASTEAKPEEEPKKKTSALDSARSTISIGLPVGSGFFASMAAAKEDNVGEEAGPLAVALSDDSDATGLLAETVNAKIGKDEYVLSAAARKDDLVHLLELAHSDGEIPVGCEPPLWGALRSSWRKLSPASGSAPELRLWFGESFSFLSLARGRTPLALEEIPRSGETESDAIVSAAARILSQLNRGPKCEKLKRFVVHGDEMIPVGLLERLEALAGTPAHKVAADPLDGQTIAEGLAFGALSSSGPRLNLARSLQKPPSILATLPWLDMLLVGALALVLFVALGVPAMNLDRKLAEARAQERHFNWAQGKTNTQLSKQASTLRREIEPLAKYLTEGVQWTPVYAEIPGTLPPGAWLTAIHSEDMIWARRQEKEFGQRFLLLRESTPLGPDGSAPLGIDEALANLRDSRLSDLGFPTIRLTDVHWRKLGTSETTGFSIAALPKNKMKATGK